MSTSTTFPHPDIKASPLRAMAAASMLAVGVCILAFAMSESNAANRDYICYWAAGHQLANHANPYDGEQILRLERSAGFRDNRAFFMRNPPSAFFLALPLGFAGAKAGAVLWSLALIAALVSSIRFLWFMHGRSPDRLHMLGYLFAPVLACLLAGQIGIFILFGVILFLRFHATQPYLAGAALLLCSLKPHLFLPFGVVLLAWVVTRKAYRILVGASATMIASIGLSFLLDPAGWSQYGQMVHGEKLQGEFIPTVSLMFRLLIDRNALWLQLVPASAACLWALGYFWEHCEQWDWLDHGSLLLLVSVMFAPYAWFTDEAVVLPAILAGVYRTANSGRSLLLFGCVGAIALIEVLTGAILNSGFYLWTAPAWLAWYLWTLRKTS